MTHEACHVVPATPQLSSKRYFSPSLEVPDIGSEPDSQSSLSDLTHCVPVLPNNCHYESPTIVKMPFQDNTTSPSNFLQEVPSTPVISCRFRNNSRKTNVREQVKSNSTWLKSVSRSEEQSKRVSTISKLNDHCKEFLLFKDLEIFG